MSRLAKRGFEHIPKTENITFDDLMDDGIKSLFRMDIDNTLDAIIGDFNDEEMEMFFQKKKTYTEKKELLHRINQIYDKHRVLTAQRAK